MKGDTNGADFEMIYCSQGKLRKAIHKKIYW